MLELEKKEGEDYTKEMMLNELMETVKAGKVIAPVGTKTLMVFAVGPDNRLDAAGMMAPEHADEIAYWIMSQKRGMVQQGAQNGPSVE